MGDEAVSALINEIEQSWNTHDMRRFAACFADDADFVNVAGMWVHGRDEIESLHRASHERAFKNSTLDLQPASVREIAPGAWVAHVKWRMVGHTIGGPQRTSEPREGVQSFVIRERDGRLEIVSAHNTDTIQR